MLRMADLIGRELKWTQPHALKMEYVLLTGETVAATLNFRSSFGSLATLTSADGIWTFKRVGFLQTSVTIRANGSDVDLASFKNNTWHGGGTLEISDGRKYPANTNFWSTQFEFKTEASEPLIRYEKIGGVLHSSSNVSIFPLAKNLVELPWMVGLGWYLTIMMQMESAAVVAVIAATSASTTAIR